MANQEKYASDYDQASKLFIVSTAKGIGASKALLVRPGLPWHWQIRTLLLLAAAVNNWCESQKYLLHAEYTWKEIRRAFPEGQDEATDSILAELHGHLDEVKQLQAECSPTTHEDSLSVAFAATEIDDLHEFAKAHLESAMGRSYHQHKHSSGCNNRQANGKSGRFFQAMSDDESVPGLLSDNDESEGEDSEATSDSDVSENSGEEENVKDLRKDEVNSDSEKSLIVTVKPYRSHTKLPDDRRIRVRNDEFNDRSKATYELEDKKTVKYKFSGLQHRITKRLQSLGHEQNVAAKRVRGRGFRNPKKRRKTKGMKEKTTITGEPLLETR